MTSPTEKQDEFDALLDSYLAELMAMSDDEVLDSDDPATLKAQGQEILNAAKAECGRRRLMAAREKLASRKPTSGTVLEMPISVQDARAFLHNASNDPRFTLAARGLDEMSDEDALRLYRQIKRLELAGKKTPSGNEP